MPRTKSTTLPAIPNGLTRLRDFAEKQSISPKVVYHLAHQGKIRVFRIPGWGTTSFIEAKEVMPFLKPREVTVKPSIV